MPLNQLTDKTLNTLNNLGIRLNPEGSLNNRDFQDLQDWANKFPDYPIEWLENLDGYISEQGVVNFSTVLKWLNASAARQIPVGVKPETTKRQGEFSENKLERHFKRVEELRQIEGTQEWNLSQRMNA